MNTEGCIAPMATDQFLVVVEDVGLPACDANLAGFAVWLGILTLLKIITGVGLSMDWYMRYRTREGRARLAKGTGVRPGMRASDRMRYPVVPTMNLVQAVLYLLLLVFASAGTCSSQNGCGLAMYCSMYLLFAGYCIVLLKQFVALGKRMIPLARSKLDMMKGMTNSSDGAQVSGTNTNEASNSGAETLDVLGKEDTILRILIHLQALCAMLQIVFGVPVQLAEGSRNQYELWLSLAFGFQAGFFLFNMLGFLLQLQRLIIATKVGCSKPYNPDVLKALGKMRQTQVAFTLMHFGALSLTFLIAVRVIPVRWFVVLLLLSLETGSTTLTFVKFALGKLMKKPRHVKQAVPAEDKKMNVTSDENDATQGSMLTLDRPSVIFNGSTASPAPPGRLGGDLSVTAHTSDG